MWLALSLGCYSSNCKNGANSGWANNWTECLSIIHAFLLIVSLCNQASFQPIQGPIRIEFGLENPFAPNHIHVRLSRDQDPSVIVIIMDILIVFGLGGVVGTETVNIYLGLG
jgi:hypothetical protein